jgi:hypothetical protein
MIANCGWGYNDYDFFSTKPQMTLSRRNTVVQPWGTGRPVDPTPYMSEILEDSHMPRMTNMGMDTYVIADTDPYNQPLSGNTIFLRDKNTPNFLPPYNNLSVRHAGASNILQLGGQVIRVAPNDAPQQGVPETHPYPGPWSPTMGD